MRSGLGETRGLTYEHGELREGTSDEGPQFRLVPQGNQSHRAAKAEVFQIPFHIQHDTFFILHTIHV